MHRKDVGYIYVVQMDGHDLYKVGRSVNVPRRMSEFGVQLPFKFKLLFAHKVPDVREREEQLHRDLRRYRCNGEWFNLMPEFLQWIQCYLLLVQANRLIIEIQERFGHEDLYSSRLLRYGNLFIKLAERLERRLRHMNRASVAINRALSADAPTLEDLGLTQSESVS